MKNNFLFFLSLIIMFGIFTGIIVINESIAYAETSVIDDVVYDFSWNDFSYIWNSMEDYMLDESIAIEERENAFRNSLYSYCTNRVSVCSETDYGELLDEFLNLTAEERRLSILHPIYAYQLISVKEAAYNKAHEFYTSNAHQNSHDAFRHAYWNALMLRLMGYNLAKEFADAHESEPDLSDKNYEIDVEMDLYNNEVGRQLALEYPNLSDEELAYKIVSKVSFGYMKIFSSNNELISSNRIGLKAETIYDFTNIGDNQIRIDRVKLEIEDRFTIPETINERIVCSLADYAFQGQSLMTIVMLPDTIESIGSLCFYDCQNLAGIFAQNTQITRLEFGTFLTSNNTVVYLPDGITYISDSALAYTSPRKLNLSGFNSSSLTYIGNSAFYASNLKDFVFSSNLTYIGDYAFKDSNLSGIIYIASSVSAIGYRAFSGTEISCIYTEKSPNPSGWSSDWNVDLTTVVYNCTFSANKSYIVSINKTSTSLEHVSSSGIPNPTRSGYIFGGWYTTSDYTGNQYMDLATAPNSTLYAKWTENSSSCITEGSLITLSNGTQVPVENLTGTETLLVWDFINGCYATAPILFIDSEELNYYNVIKLLFSDGNITKVVSEHGFYDLTLNRYVYITEDNYQEYIGHMFKKDNSAVTLSNAYITNEYTRVYSPVTVGHLNYYVNGLLTMPGNTESFANIFDVDMTTMTYINMEQDILTYGLYTYEEFISIINIEEDIFNAFNGQYLKIAIGKGITSLEEIQELLDRYSVCFE